MAVTIQYDTSTYSGRVISGEITPRFAYNYAEQRGIWTFYSLKDTILSGGSADIRSTTVDQGAPEFFADQVTVCGDGGMDLTAGATASGTIVCDGGKENVLAGYLAATIAYQSSQQFSGICRAGSSLDAVISSGGTQCLEGGYASGTTILAGGTQTIAGTLCVLKPVSSVDGSAHSSSFTGLAAGTIVSANGLQVVNGSGVAEGTILLAGGTAVAKNGGILSGVIQSGGSVWLSNGGILAGMQVKSGQSLQWLGTGGTAMDNVILAGGLLNVSSASAEGNTVYGTLNVYSNGKTQTNFILKGGLVSAAQGGLIGYDQIMTGGSLVCSVSGTVSGATILSGGSGVISSGGTASLIKVRKGGKLTLKSGAAVDEIDAAGSITAENGVKIEKGAMLYFKLDLNEPDSAYVIDAATLDSLSGITLATGVDNYAYSGTYNLIGGLSDFTGSITVLNSEGKAAGSIAAGESISVDGNVYELNLNRGTLSLDFTSQKYLDTNTITVVAGTATSESYTPKFLPETAGEYTIDLTLGDSIPASKLNGSISLKQGKSTIGTWSVKQGVVSDTGFLVSPSSDQQITVDVKFSAIPASSFTADSVTIKLNGELLTKAGNDDDFWQSLPDSCVFRPASATVDADLFANEWVGFGDLADYRMLALDAGGDLTFTITATGNATKASLILYAATGDGSKLKAIQTLDFTTAGNTEIKAGTLSASLAAGNYYCAVVPKSVTKTTTGSVDYDIHVSGELNFKPENNSHDDTFDAAGTNQISRSWQELSGYENWIGADDSADTVQFTLDGPGTYSFSLSGVSAGAQVRFDLNKVVLGKMTKVQSVTAKASGPKATAAAISGICLGAYEPDATYSITVTLLNASNGYDTNFSITAQGEANPANNADDVYLTAQELALNESKSDWVGYGDLVDYYHLQVTDAGDYTFSLGGAAKAPVNFSVWRGCTDAKGKYTLTSVIAKTKTSLGASSKKSVSLVAGDYYVCIEGGSQKDASGNAAYALSASCNAWDSLSLTEQWQTISPSDGTQKVVLNRYAIVKTDSASGLTIWQDNSQSNKKQTVALKKQEALLAPGTYYFDATAQVKVQADYDDPSLLEYEDAIITDNNVWSDASPLAEIGSWSGDTFKMKTPQWVGYGDACDYYQIDVDGKTSGDWNFAFSGDSKNATMTLYAFDGSALKSLKSGTAFTVSALSAGSYYLCIASKSATAAASAKNTDYSISIDRDTMKTLSLNGSVSLGKNEYAQIAMSDAIITAKFSGAVSLFAADGKGGMTKVTLSKENQVQLGADTQYYVKSSAGGKVSLSSSEAKFDDANTLYAINSNGVTSLTTTPAGETISAQVGLDHAADCFVFNTGTSETYGKDGYFMAYVKSADGILQSGAKYSVTLYQQVNGADKKLQSQSITCSGQSAVGKALTSSLAADATFTLEVATSDKGNGSSAGNFEVAACIYEFDHTNDTFQDATVLDAGESLSGTVAKSGNAVDFFDLEAFSESETSCKINLNKLADGSYGAVKLSFYDEYYQAIKELKTVTLSDKMTSFSVSPNYDAKFVKIEANGSGCGYFTIGK